MNTYKWSIVALETAPQIEEKTNVILTAHWRLDATNGNLTAGIYGSVGLPFESDGVFVDYALLTEEDVLGWVKSILGAEQVATFEANLDGQLLELARPKIVNVPLPWAVNK